MTLLIGQNNVGKTSAYAPLLLLRQTLGAQNPDTALLFRGDLVDFGTYADVITDHDVSRTLSMSLDFGPVSRPRRQTERTPPRSLEITFAASSDHPADLIKSVVNDEQGDSLVRRTLQPSGVYKVASPLLPRSTEVGRPLREVTELRKALQSEEPRGFLFTGFSGLVLPASWRQDAERWRKVQGWYRAASELYDTYSLINDIVVESLEGISYIGPLRSSPRRSYLVSAEPPLNVGRDGEWASELLYRSYERADSDVLDRTNRWLDSLGYGQLTFRSLGEYFQVFVRKQDSSVEVNLADCGVGLSQLLPILVQGCVMRPGQTLIAQQPEIHLNPAQQDVITDFLIELCASGRRVIIETHSEHILTRLRRRIAEGNSVPSTDVGLYFSESLGDRSNLRRISIGELGELSAEEWPKGFFGQQLENSLKMAIAQSRRRKKESAEACPDA